ncbi:MAG: hypothetical protein HC842_09085 [Cytophagales bacterium]|nr:hypothetical protein [Cytophagales bacterium]
MLRRYLLQLALETPFYQELRGDQLGIAARISLGLVYNLPLGVSGKKD